MNVRTRIALFLTLILAIAGPLAAQEQAEPATSTATAAAKAGSAETTPSTTSSEQAAGELAEQQSSYEIRNEFSRQLRRHPPELAKILAIDPSLLSSDAFLAGYPSVARFVTAHPEVRRNPKFYLSEFPSGDERRQESMFEQVFEGLTIFSVFLFIALALGWLVRTIIEQKRWNRLSRTQTDVHTKILDRFASSEELLAYIKTPAGTKFLESAPIPLHADSAPQNAPLARVMWSVQIGVVVAAGALGMLLVSLRLEKEAAEGLFAMGTIFLSVGAGFIASALVSVVLSRRLGLWPGSAQDAALQNPDA